MPLLKDAQGQLGTVQEDQILDALRTGNWWAGAENATLAMISPEGKRVGVKFRPDEIQARARQGFRLETPDEEHRVWTLHENKSDAAAFALGAMRGLTFGASDWALNKSGILTGEQLSAYSENSPGWSTTGEVVGAVAPAFATGGAGILPKMGASAAKGVLARTPAGLLAAGSTRLEAALVKRMGDTALRRAASKGAALGLEGAVYGGGQAILSDPVLTGDPIVAQQILTHIGLGAITGAVLGAGTSLIGSGVRKVAQGVRARMTAPKAPGEFWDAGLGAEPVPGQVATPGMPQSGPGAAAAADEQAIKQTFKAAGPEAAKVTDELQRLEASYADAMKREAFDEAAGVADRIKKIKEFGTAAEAKVGTTEAKAAGAAEEVVPAEPTGQRLKAAQDKFDEAQETVAEFLAEIDSARTPDYRRKMQRKLVAAKSRLADATEERALAMEKHAGLPVSGGELAKIRQDFATKYPKAPAHVLDDLADTWTARDKAWRRESSLKLELETPGLSPDRTKDLKAQIRAQKDISFQKLKHFGNLTKRVESEVSVEEARVVLEKRANDLEGYRQELTQAKGKNPRARIKYKIKQAEADLKNAQKTIDEAPPPMSAEPAPVAPEPVPGQAILEAAPEPAIPGAPPAKAIDPTAYPTLPTNPTTPIPGPAIPLGSEGLPFGGAPTPAAETSALLNMLKGFPGKIGQLAGAFEKGGAGKIAPMVGGYIGYKGAEIVGIPPWLGAGLGGAVIGPMLAARAAAISARAAETVLESRVAKVVASAVKGTVTAVGEQGARTAQRMAWEAFSEGSHERRKSPSKLGQGEDIQKAFDRALHSIEQSSDPETFVRAMQEKFSNIANASPALMTQISATATRAFIHLREKAPLMATISPQQIISGQKPRVSSNEIRSWFDRVDVAFKGLPVLMERMSRGTLTPQMVETAQHIFPESYEKMVQQVAFQISERAQKGGIIDRRFKLQLAMLGVGLDSDLISAADNSFAAKEVGVVLQDKQLRAKPGSLNRLASAYNRDKRAQLPTDRNQKTVE